MWLTLLLLGSADAQSRPVAVPRPQTTYRPPVRHVYTTRPNRSVYVSVGVDPWSRTWHPAPRAGWLWVDGRWDPYGYWSPGYWRASAPVPSGWAYVDGYWDGAVYVDGWYRTPRRAGWIWVETRYRSDGSVVAAHWRPIQNVPDGFVWEPGYFDGNGYVEGFWRPAYRDGFRWVPARWFDDGSRAAGFWSPNQPREGSYWVPGYFDGTTWVEGGWGEDDTQPVRTPRPSDGALAIPVTADGVEAAP